MSGISRVLTCVSLYDVLIDVLILKIDYLFKFNTYKSHIWQSPLNFNIEVSH